MPRIKGALEAATKASKGALRAAEKASAKPKVSKKPTVWKTPDGYTFYELPNGKVVDNLDPESVDMSWPNTKEFIDDMEGTAFREGDELGERRSTIESYGRPDPENIAESTARTFDPDDPEAAFRRAVNKQRGQAELKSSLSVVPGGKSSEVSHATESVKTLSPEEFRAMAEKGMIQFARGQDQELRDLMAGKTKFAELSLNWDLPETYDLEEKLKSQGFKVKTNRQGPSLKTYVFTDEKDLEPLFKAKTPAGFGKAYGYSDEDIARFYFERGLGPKQFSEDMAEITTNPEQSKSAAGIQGGSDINKAKGGAVDHKLKAWHQSQMMAKGGEVKMAPGGDPAQIQAQMAAGVPVFMSKGPEGDIARQMILEEEDARRRAELERQARIEALPFGQRLAGRGEAARTLGSAVGRSMAAPFVALAKGEKAAKEFAEDVPIPQTEAGAYYTGRAAEVLEGPAKFLEAAKIPDTPLTEIIPTTYIPGLGKQLTSIAGKAARSIDEVVPESLKNLPVGASIKPVGPEGEKLTVNQLIAKLEAGEDLTPEQRQRAEYSKAQKEKYAQANMARQAKEPAPKDEKVKVPANELGFYSSVEKGLANTTRTEGSGQDFINDIMKANPSSGELEGTGIIDWLKTQDKVTKQDVQDYLDGHKIEIKETVRGAILDDMDRQRFNDINRRMSQGKYDLITPEDEEWFEATRARMAEFKEPKYESENLILPGGKNYREITLSLPEVKNAPIGSGKSAATMLFEREMMEKYGGQDFPSVYQKLTPSEIDKYDMYVREDINSRKTESILQDKRNNFQSSHFPEKNILAHMRMQDMNIGGKKTLVIEEIQSDWHQAGRTKGYAPKDLSKVELEAVINTSADKPYYEIRTKEGQFVANIVDVPVQEGNENLAVTKGFEFLKERGIPGAPPDAPYKKDWYQLAIKRLMRYAADNDYDQIALVGPEEQIRRGSLGTYVDGLTFEKNKDGSIKLMAEKGESVVLDKTVKPEDLELYVGKNVAKKILSTEDVDGTLTGDDLMIGGEGMRQYYGRSYPDSINRIGKKYNANIEKRDHIIREYGPDDVEERETGEVDRFGRPTYGYLVRDPETGDDVVYEDTFEKALSEANKKAPKTSMWFMDLPPKLKSDVKIGQSFKEGGAVTKDKDLMRWHKIQQLAAGGAIRRLAKSAEKALEKAKRMTREEAEKAGLWHDISDIKLEKPLSEVQKKVVKNPKSKLAEKKVISPEELQGGTAVQLLGDRAAAGQILEELEGVPMNIELQGGPGFMREHGGWASHKVPLSKLEKKIRTVQESGDPVYGVYTAMGPQGVDFNTFVSESLVKSLDLSELRKKDIDKFNQEVRKDIPGFVGIESPGLLESLIIGPGAQRTKFVQTMAKEDFQKAGFPNVGFARYAVTEPELLDVPIGQAGYSISEFGPEMKMEQKSGHRTYPYDLTGTYIGGLAQPLPADVMFPSFFEARRLLSKPESGGYRAMQMSAPVQQLDQEWLDNAMQYLEMQKKLTGKKKGGLASIKVRNKRNG